MLADGGLVLFLDPEQHAEHAHRDLGREVLDVVELALLDDAVERALAVLAHHRLDRVHGRGVNTRESSWRWMVWVGGSS